MLKLCIIHFTRKYFFAFSRYKSCYTITYFYAVKKIDFISDLRLLYFKLAKFGLICMMRCFAVFYCYDFIPKTMYQCSCVCVCCSCVGCWSCYSVFSRAVLPGTSSSCSSLSPGRPTPATLSCSITSTPIDSESSSSRWVTANHTWDTVTD